jgi:RNase P subunit RPR2
MTAKQITTIDFTEINKIEITCIKCGAALVFPIPDKDVAAHNPPKHNVCIGCETPLWTGENDQRYITALGLIRGLAFWKELKEKGFSLSFSIGSSH